MATTLCWYTRDISRESTFMVSWLDRITHETQAYSSCFLLTSFLIVSHGSQLGEKMIWNSKIKQRKKKEKKGSGKSNTLAVGDERLLWLHVSSNPSQEEMGDERSRGRGGLSESTCFLRGMWETGTVVASLMSLVSACYKHRTHTHILIHKQVGNKHTFTHEDILQPLGSPAFKVLSSSAVPTLHTL